MYVFSLGGSIIFKDKKYDIDYLYSFKKAISFLDKKIIIVGGGYKARELMKKEENNFKKDLLGIKQSLLNAKFVSKILKIPFFTLSYYSLKKLPDSFVSGGVFPGFSTDFVAAVLAEKYNAKFINISNVDGIYNKDPYKFKDAKFIPKININDAIKISNDERNPGSHSFLDIFALKILKRSKIEAYLMGKNIRNLKSFLKGERSKYSKIIYD